MLSCQGTHVLHNVARWLDLYRLSFQIGKLKSHKLVVFGNDAQAVHLNREKYAIFTLSAVIKHSCRQYGPHLVYLVYTHCSRCESDTTKVTIHYSDPALFVYLQVFSMHGIQYQTGRKTTCKTVVSLVK